MMHKYYYAVLVSLLFLFTSIGQGAASDTVILKGSESRPNSEDIKKWTPVQASIWNPLQIYREDWDVYGLRFNLLFGKNKNLYGIDMGLFNEFTDKAMGVQLGLMNFDSTMNFDVPDFDSTGNMDEYMKVCRPSFSGLQLGVVNQSGIMKGMQLGFGNSSAMTTGIQMGILNNTTGSVNGVQVGLLGVGAVPISGNMATEVNGLQLGILGMMPGSLSGVQINVIGSFAKKSMKGVQIGFINYARESNGLQIGLFNYTEKMKGVQIGLINYISETEWLLTPVINVHF